MTTNNPDTLPGKRNPFGGDWPTICPKCIYPGAHRPRFLDVGPVFRCVSCGTRWSIDLVPDPADPGILRGVAVPAA